MSRGKDRFTKKRDIWRMVIHSQLNPLPQDSPENENWIRNHNKEWLDRLSRSDGWQREGYVPEPTLSNAFAFFGLDKTNERDRAILLNVLADIVFARPKKGRKRGIINKSWDPAKLLDLAIRDRQCGLNNDSKTAEELKRRFKDYKRIQREAIRQRLPEARLLFENLRAGKEVVFNREIVVWALDLNRAYKRAGTAEEVPLDRAPPPRQGCPNGG